MRSLKVAGHSLLDRTDRDLYFRRIGAQETPSNAVGGAMYKSLLTAIVAAVALAVPSLADAATRYSTPTPGSGADCSQADPCSIATALSGASAGDTVVVGAGTYGSATSPLGPLGDGGNHLTIEGATTGAGRPVLMVDSTAIFDPMFTLSGVGSTIQDIEITGTAGDDGLELDAAGETANRVVVIQSAGSNGDACALFSAGANATILDSLCVNKVPDQYSGVGVQSSTTATLRNDTFVGAYGLFSSGTTTVVNSILHGTGQQDLYPSGGTLTLTDSEFASVTAGGSPYTATGQVTGAPSFISPGTNNYRVTSSSPGVDKGLDNAANGQYDLDANLRTLGTHTDIGAYEVVPTTPTVTTGGASAIAQTQATISGTISPAGAAVQYHFEYGTTTGFGRSTAVTAVPGQTASEAPTATLTGLAPLTRYYYRLVAEIDGAEYDGAPQQFTTAAPPPPHNTAAPTITGTAKAHSVLSCSTGTWTGSVTSYKYEWFRDGTQIQGATGSKYTIGTSDEGTTLSCEVTAIGPGGAGAPALSRSVKVSVPHVPRCPAATGSVHGESIGLAHLGMTRKQARHAYSHSSNRGYKYKEFFCLTPHGVRVGFASPKLLRGLSKRAARNLSGRVVWISTDYYGYAIRGIRAGATLSAAERALPHGYLFRVGKNQWYIARAGSASAVLKVRNGVVQEVGIADLRLTRTHKRDRELMTSFD
jgi:hypothetical protein